MVTSYRICSPHCVQRLELSIAKKPSNALRRLMKDSNTQSSLFTMNRLTTTTSSPPFLRLLQCRPLLVALVGLILLGSAPVAVQAQQNETVATNGNSTTVGDGGEGNSNETLLSPTAAAAADNTPTLAPIRFEIPDMGCFADLSEVADRVAAKNGYQVETYTLCPNTIYKIGSTGTGTIVEGGSPPLTLRQNTRYICGSDGKSSNNCVLTGGQFQLLSLYNAFDYEIKSNIVLKGITFENGQTAGVLLVAPGDVIFDDCIFRVSHVC